MGTNYYAKIGTCPHCSRPKWEIHIGKNSFGWTFNLRGYKFDSFSSYDERNNYLDFELNSWQDWKKLLTQPNVIVYDEYGTEEKDIQNFIKMVEEKQNDPKNKNHSKIAISHWGKEGYVQGWGYVSKSNIKQNKVDQDGYSISYYEFS